MHQVLIKCFAKCFVVILIVCNGSISYGQSKIIKEIVTKEYVVLMTDSTSLLDDIPAQIVRTETKLFDKQGKMLQKGKYKYYYKEGLLIKKKHLSNKTLYFYDSNKNQIKELRYRIKGRLTYYVESSYNERNQKIHSEMYNAEDSSLASYTNYKYSIDGKLNQIESYKSDSTLSRQKEIHYNNKGDEFLYIINTSSDKFTFRFDYKYDNYGNWVKKQVFKNNVIQSIYTRDIIYW